ncbi:MAG: TlpA family protein disulfide reductase [Clostridia bacterium]|nr:TlpA family protein disulfide reductase [Clostridia bacterium]
MKKAILWVVSVLVLAVFIAGAMVLYDNLSDNYSGDNVVTTPEKETEEEADFSAPDFEVTDKDGNRVKLSDFEGKPVVLNFWATWCHYCKVEMPDFNKAYENYPEVQFVMVNATDGVQETMEKARAYIEKEKFSFDVFYDTEMDAVGTYYITSFPSTFFIDKDGNLVARASGALDYDSLVRGIEMINK